MTVTSPIAGPMMPQREAAPRRRRRRGLWLVGVLLVASGGLVSATVVSRAGGRMPVLAVARTVHVGQPLAGADLVTAWLPADPTLRPVPAADRAGVIGAVAAVELRPGALLTRAELTDRRVPDAGQQLVGLPLRDGQWPARGLTPGDRVVVVAVPGDQSISTQPGGQPAGAASEPVAATVAELGPRGDDGVTTVDVIVPAAAAVELAATASTGRLAVVLVPAAG